MQRPGTMRRASGPTSELSGASQPSRVMRRGFTNSFSLAEGPITGGTARCSVRGIVAR